MIKAFVVIILLIIVFFIIVMIVDCHRLVIKKYQYESSKLKKDLRIVLLTDLHGVSFGKGNKRLIDKINSLKPDLIMVSGDMYTAYKNNDTSVPSQLLLELSSVYPVYYANGNHELKTQIRVDEFGDIYEHFTESINENDMHHLVNEREFIEEYNVDICGLNLPFEYYKKGLKIVPDVEKMDELLGQPNDMSVNILLAHNPEYFEQYVKWGADLILSGHYHGGLMKIPFIGGFISPRYTLFPKYDYGEYIMNGRKMILSCGLGTHTLPIRIFNPGEISYIECKVKA